MFREVVGREVRGSLEDLGQLSLNSDAPQQISSVCAVFAESEIINLVTGGVSVENIIRGIHDSLAQRALQLLKRVGLEPEVTFVGGMALQSGQIKALEASLGLPVNVAETPDLVAALGAALLGKIRLETKEQVAA